MAKQNKTGVKSDRGKRKAAAGADGGKGPRLGTIIKEGGLLLLAAIAFYLFICLISFSPEDPGPFQVGGRSPVENWGGGVGAWIADLMFNVFGKMAYLFIVLIGAAAWHLIDEGDISVDKISLASIVSPILGFIFAMVGATTLDNLYIQDPVALPYVSGGMLGDISNQLLLPRFGAVGTTMIALGLFLSGVTLVTRLSWFALMDWLGARGFMLFERAAGHFSGFRDSLLGAAERKRRTESVSQLREKIVKKKPPRITPKISEARPSKRVEDEKQIPLFVTETTGELPPLALLDPVKPSGKGYTKQGQY